jgi:hypothetical protein
MEAAAETQLQWSLPSSDRSTAQPDAVDLENVPPQWSLPLSDRSTLAMLPLVYLITAPQWSLPLSGRNTHVGQPAAHLAPLPQWSLPLTGRNTACSALKSGRSTRCRNGACRIAAGARLAIFEPSDLCKQVAVRAVPLRGVRFVPDGLVNV